MEDEPLKVALLEVVLLEEPSVPGEEDWLAPRELEEPAEMDDDPPVIIDELGVPKGLDAAVEPLALLEDTPGGL